MSNLDLVAARLPNLTHRQPCAAPADGSRGRSLEDIRGGIQGDAVAAIAWLADPDALIGDQPGIRVVKSSSEASEVEEETDPDFAALFPVCRCGKDDCDDCGRFQMTPRTAMTLWTMADILAERAYDDVSNIGDEPITHQSLWILHEYPQLTWTQDAVWRRQAARAFDDLAGDLAAGQWLVPRCPGEEMALHLMLRYAQLAIEDDWGPIPEHLATLPEHPDDFEWSRADEALLEDDDIPTLFNADLDAIEDPDNDANRDLGMGDYGPETWFRPFKSATRRDGRRGFRS